MRKILAVGLVLAAFGALCACAYQRFPRPEPEFVKVRWVEETLAVSNMVTRRLSDGTEVIEEGPPLTRMVPVHETMTRLQSPMLIEWAQFVAVVGVMGLYMLYAGSVLRMWWQDKRSKAKPNANTRDTQKRLDGVVHVAAGILMGVLGTASYTDWAQKAEPPPGQQNLPAPEGPKTAPAEPENAPRPPEVREPEKVR